MKKKNISVLAVALAASLLFSSCGTMTKKKKPRFGGCHVTMVAEQATPATSEKA